MAPESKRLRITAMVVGFVIAILLAWVDPGSDSTRNVGLVAAQVILCPPVLLSIPLFVFAFEAAEYGTPLYFAIWGIVALLNAGLYAAVAPPIIKAIRKNWDFTPK